MTDSISILVNAVQDLHRQANKVPTKLHEGENAPLKALKAGYLCKYVAAQVQSPVLQLRVEAEIKNKERNIHGRRWSEEQKLAELYKYKLSPKAYRVDNQLMILLSSRTLSRMLAEIPAAVGCNESLLEAVKVASAHLKPHEKFVSLMFDEMVIKTRLMYHDRAPSVKGFADYGEPEPLAIPADHALLFMIRGIATNYKQPIGYYYTASAKGLTPARRLSSLIEHGIRAVNSTGLQVIHAVCD